MLEKSEFRRREIKILESQVAYDGFFRLEKISLKHKKFAEGWTGPIERELFTKGPCACAVLYDPHHDLIGLVEQFRIGAIKSPKGAWTLECVAGMMEEGETAEAMVRRELKEEAGIDHAELIYITSFYPTPGSCDEYVYLYCALCNLKSASGLFGLEEESEDIRLHVFGAQEVFSAMLKGRTDNGATLIALLWLQMNRESLLAGKR